MKYTIQDYQNVIDIVLGSTASEGLIAHCKAKILELSSPALRKYKCISRENIDWVKIGEIYDASVVVKGFFVSQLPFHFELIPEPVKVEPISIEGILFILEEACCMGEYSHRCAGLAKKIKADHNL